MSKLIKVGIVIVSYRTAELTVNALKSVFSEIQISPNLSIHAVVVDNASGDATYVQTAIEDNGWSEWADLVVSEKNGGFGYGNNLGFKHLQEKYDLDYVHFLNPDASCLHGAIGELVKQMEMQPKVGVAGGSFLNADGSLWPIAFRYPSMLGEIDTGFKIGLISRLLKPWIIAVNMEQVVQTIDWVIGASMIVRADLFTKLRGFDESFFLYYEETDLCKRANALGYTVLYVPTSKVIHISGQSTKFTERKVERKRFPYYWYESRSLYFLKHHGVAYSLINDFLVICATAIGVFKMTIIPKKHDTATHFAIDMIKNSVLCTRVRQKAAFRSSIL